MLKRMEASEPNSCWNKALDDERIFVLLSRDAASPSTIRFWIEERIRLGKNERLDPQIIEAENAAKLMELQRNQRDSA